MDHNASKSSLGTYPNEIKLIPLELRPILDQEDRRKEELRRKSGDVSIYSASEHGQYHNYKDSKIPRRQIVPKCPRGLQRKDNNLCYSNGDEKIIRFCRGCML